MAKEHYNLSVKFSHGPNLFRDQKSRGCFRDGWLDGFMDELPLVKGTWFLGGN